ncbi:winged helix-turn-helix domain-containing protein [Sulfuracidifex metallicus DSM 6482 = JCM 9184]|nr:winged helix-turn-helix domain-containing protein [Sulfuracidifex metallicus DSM 6482 = JCM 9184]
MTIRRSSMCLDMEIILAIYEGQENRSIIIKSLGINSIIFDKHIEELIEKNIVKKKENGYFELTEKDKKLAIKIKKLYEISQSINFIEEEVKQYLEISNSQKSQGVNGIT